MWRASNGASSISCASSIVAPLRPSRPLTTRNELPRRSTCSHVAPPRSMRAHLAAGQGDPLAPEASESKGADDAPLDAHVREPRPTQVEIVDLAATDVDGRQVCVIQLRRFPPGPLDTYLAPGAAASQQGGRERFGEPAIDELRADQLGLARLQCIEGAVTKRGDAEVVAGQVSSRESLAAALIVGRQGSGSTLTQDARACEVEAR